MGAFETAKQKTRETCKNCKFRDPQERMEEAREGNEQQSKADSYCHACGQKGHWSRDPECPKRRKKGGERRKKKKAMMVKIVKVPDPWRRQMDTSSLKTRTRASLSSSVRGRTMVKDNTCRRKREKGSSRAGVRRGLRAVLVSGCQRTLLDTRTLQKMLKRYPQLKKTIVKLPDDHVFVLADGEESKSLYKVTLKVRIFGREAELVASVLKGSIPLFNKQTASQGPRPGDRSLERHSEVEDFAFV